MMPAPSGIEVRALFLHPKKLSEDDCSPNGSAVVPSRVTSRARKNMAKPLVLCLGELYPSSWFNLSRDNP